MKIPFPFLRRERDTGDGDDGGFRDITYTPENPCPYDSCHHNQPEAGEGPPS